MIVVSLLVGASTQELGAPGEQRGEPAHRRDDGAGVGHGSPVLVEDDLSYLAQRPRVVDHPPERLLGRVDLE
jgi:hypothetical protein